MKNKLLLLLFCISINSLFAQKKGDKLYKNLGYLTAADHYQDLKEDKQTYEIKLKLANSFRLNSQYEAAEYWFAQIINEAQEVKTILHYAQVLQANGKCEDAIRWYREYADQSKDDTRSYIQNCQGMGKFENYKNIKIKNLKELNTEHLDFSPIPYKGGIYFTSMRGGKRSLKSNTDIWTKDNFSDLFFAKKEGDRFGDVKTLKGEVNGNFHDGVATFNAGNKQMIFTRTGKKKSEEGDIKNLKIYSAKGEGIDWSEVKELPFCDKDFSTCHPSLSDDGQRLYFSSDRPGGFGGMDIYMSRKQSNNWSDPINLGPTVNTSGNEIFPFYSQKGKLFFASDGHRGIGGLDIFIVEKSDNTDENSWSNRKNLGKPFNSKKDDFGFFSNAEESEGYFSSNRPGGAGQDDIYSWEIIRKKPKKNKKDPFGSNATPIESTWADQKETEKSYSSNNQTYYTRRDTNYYREITINDSNKEYYENSFHPPEGNLKNQKNTDKYYSDSKRTDVTKKEEIYNGELTKSDLNNKNIQEDYDLNSNPNKDINLENREDADEYYSDSKRTDVTKKEEIYNRELTKSDLNNKNIQENYDLNSNPNKDINLENQKDKVNANIAKNKECVKLAGAVKNKEFLQFIPEATITFIDKSTGNIFTVQSDKNGKFDLCIKCKCEYDIIAEKPNFKEGKIKISTLNVPCSKSIIMNALVELELDQLNPNGENITSNYANEYLTGNPKGNYKIGQEITLSHIYYDFNKDNIRSDAAYDLDYLIVIMNGNPSMKISLASHTDSRGKIKFNQKLSEKRSKAVKKYLIKNGIAAARIKELTGYGETQLVNGCYDGIDCSEEEHRQNRRTMVTITDLDKYFIK